MHSETPGLRKTHKFAGIGTQMWISCDKKISRNVADTIVQIKEYSKIYPKLFIVSMETKGGGYVVVYIRAKMFYSGKSLSDGKYQSLSAKV